MSEQDQDLKEKIRQQFDTVIYPRTPIEQSPKNDYDRLFIHDINTPYYLRHQKLIDTKDKVILDAGIGSGYKALALAEANPGARIIGIDISPESVKTAKARLEYHGFDQAEFHVMAIEDVADLGEEFDYINCDEVLYLFPNVAEGLQAMKKVLKPTGIIRANLHSAIQRVNYFRAQELFTMMGLMDGKVETLEIEMARETMNALKDNVLLKQTTWRPIANTSEEWVAMNYLFHGDRGFTIPQLFSYVREADLEFISMVNWRHWQILDLFKERDNLPAFIAMSLPGLSVEEELHLYELLHPVHRLLDFWCGHSLEDAGYLPLSAWTTAEWARAKISLHPQLKKAQIKEDLIECIKENKPFLISDYIKLPTQSPIYIESMMGACLLPLWDESCSLQALVDRYLQILPIDPITLQPYSSADMMERLQKMIVSLEAFMYILAELD